MEWLTNEILFYGGIIIVIVSLLTAIMLFFIFKIKGIRLGAELDSEYGEEKNAKGGYKRETSCQK